MFSILVLVHPQAREKKSFQQSYTPPSTNASVISRAKYDNVVAALVETVPANEGDDPFKGMPGKKIRSLRKLLTKWERYVLVGGTVQLRRVQGPMPELHYVRTTEYPKVCSLTLCPDYVV